MIFVDDLRFALDMMVHPTKNTKKSMTIKNSMKLYYKVGLIPILIVLVIDFFLGSYTSSELSSVGFHLSTTNSILLMLGLSLASYLVLNPILILIEAGVIQLVGKLLGGFKNDYPVTVSAVTYGLLPELVIAIFSAIPLVSYIGLLWGAIVTIIALANLQKVSRAAAFGAWIGGVIVLFIIIFIVALIAIFALYGSGIFSNPNLAGAVNCIAEPGFECPSVDLTSGQVSFSFGQILGSTIYNIRMACIESTTQQPSANEWYNIDTYGIATNKSTTLLNMTSGSSKFILTLPCYNSNGTMIGNMSEGTAFEGSLWISYTKSPLQPSANVTRMAIISPEVK